MIKIDATWYFGGKIVSDPLKIPSIASKRLFFYQAQEGGGRLCEKLARITVDVAREALLTEEYNPTPLDPKYAAWKRKRFPNKPIGIMTATMLESISAFRSGDRKGWLVGIKGAEKGAVGAKTINPITKTPVGEYGYYYEIGNINQIRRPVLRYSLDKVMREYFDQTIVEDFIKPFKRIWWRETYRFR